MSDVVTLDGLSNRNIVYSGISIRLVPVARGAVHLPLLEGKVLANMFYENSADRMSFETAMKRLGGSVLNFSSIGPLSPRRRFRHHADGRGYADIAVIRHRARSGPV